jgi:hypothetical protein
MLLLQVRTVRALLSLATVVLRPSLLLAMVPSPWATAAPRVLAATVVVRVRLLSGAPPLRPQISTLASRATRVDLVLGSPGRYPVLNHDLNPFVFCSWSARAVPE